MRANSGREGKCNKGGWPVNPRRRGEETEIHVFRNFGPRVKIDNPKAEGGHGGGDDRLRDLVFRNVDVPDYPRLPGSRAGALSCLTGIAARKSVDEGRPVTVGDLVRL